jgi:TolA-binding protein
MTLGGERIMREQLIITALLCGIASGPALAQSDGTVVLRVDKLEKEMKAVQRKVFPGGAGIEPQNGPSQLVPAGEGSPASAPVADLTARVDALEAQLKSLTGQVEQDGNRLKKLEEGLTAFRNKMDERIKMIEGAGPEPTADSPAPATLKPATKSPPAKATTTALKPPKTPLAKPVAEKPAKPDTPKVDPARKTAVTAVEIPDTGDAAEDAYTYGFRLFNAKLYPEAETKLKDFVAKYPSHKRASYAQNLLGRSYLAENKPALASVAFYENYQKAPRGDRASESLYLLGVSLTRLKKLPDACKVYDEFNDVYGTKSSADLKAKVTKGRADAKCSA